MFIAGEASGDQHASHIIHHLKTQHPDWTFSGIGGHHMREAGMRVDFDLSTIAVVGFAEVIKHYPTFRQVFYDFIRLVDERKPDAIVFVDYPGFNLRMAKALKDVDTKKLYFISPQIWAWKEKRVEIIKNHIDEMMVMFKFEQDFYAKHNHKVHFVGNPLMDQIAIPDPVYISKEQPADHTIGLLPGSRTQEIKTLLPVMLETVTQLAAHNPKLTFKIIKAPTISIDLLQSYTQAISCPVPIVSGDIHAHIKSCTICLVASGTATLEVGLMAKPMVILYKTSWITWLLAKLFLKIPYIGLVNIVARNRIIPELIQNDASPEMITPVIEEFINNPDAYNNIVDNLISIRSELDGGGATLKAAKIIEHSLTRSHS
jgi:lipid-A-disaccharide synthase